MRAGSGPGQPVPGKSALAAVPSIPEVPANSTPSPTPSRLVKSLLPAVLTSLLSFCPLSASDAEKSPAEQILDATHFAENGFESARSTFKPVIDQFRKELQHLRDETRA